MENLSGEPGESLFPQRSYARTERDFLAFRKYIDYLSPEILMLQEVSSPKALQKVLPSRYSFVIAPVEGEYAKIDSTPRIYTAIAFDGSRVRITGVLKIPTGSTYRDGSGAVFYTRDSTAVQVELGDSRIWFISVHLKSSCYRPGLPEKNDSESSCARLSNELRVLSTYVRRLRMDGSKVIVGGDFNRRGLPTYESDLYLGLLKQGQMSFVRPSLRDCQTFGGNDKRPIDYFVAFDLKGAQYDVFETRYDERDLDMGYKLSDHCPVTMELRP